MIHIIPLFSFLSPLKLYFCKSIYGTYLLSLYFILTVILGHHEDPEKRVSKLLVYCSIQKLPGWFLFHTYRHFKMERSILELICIWCKSLILQRSLEWWRHSQFHGTRVGELRENWGPWPLSHMDASLWVRSLWVALCTPSIHNPWCLGNAIVLGSRVVKDIICEDEVIRVYPNLLWLVSL